MDAEEASAGGIITLITLFLVGGLLFVCCGFAIDKITEIIQMMYATQAASQLRYDIVTYQIMTFRVEPIILLIGGGINHFVNSLRETSGSIAMGTVVIGAFEMISLTLVMIACTMFGGAAIDTVIGVVSAWQIGGNPSDLFYAVEFVGPVFYGIMLLITLGLVVQYLILCVQTVDYSTSRTYSY